MTEPSRLQNRVRSAFEAARPDRRRSRERRSGTGPEESALRIDNPLVSGPDIAGISVLNSTVAGVGLLSSAFVLGAGFEVGLEVIASGIAAAGVVGALSFLRKARGASSGRQGAAERRSDRRWEHNETRELLFGLHDSLGDIAMTRDPLGRIVAANTVLRTLCGVADPIGRTCDELGLLFEPGEAHDHYRVRVQGPDGMRVFDWHNTVVRDRETGRLMMHSIARDMTREERVMRTNEAARRSAEHSSHAKSQLLATVSHEIRTPLSGILGMSHLLGQTRLTAEQTNYLAGMRQSGHALVQLVEDLLDFSTIEAGRFQLRPADDNLRELLESVVEMLSSRAHEKGIEIASSVAAEIPMLMQFDAARLRQVLFNVIGNAVKFTHSGGVFVSAGVEAGECVIRVEDSGKGMSDAELERIFDDFEQAGETSQKVGGTGLGLSISRRIMDAFGGSLTASSQRGRGSCFTIRFPFAELASGHDLRRDDVLGGTVALILAPVGPVARALEGTITSLGGAAITASAFGDAEKAVAMALNGGAGLTDVIVDHRHASQFRRLLALHPGLAAAHVRKTYLVNPEERLVHPINQVDGYQTWLIRPLRERTLVDVLKGRMRGLETRDAINDNRPILREAPPIRVVEEVTPARPSAPQRSVLLAEDDPVNAMLVRSMLEKAGFAVRVVGTFPAVADALFDAPEQARLHPALLVTDVNMPGGDAFSMIRQIRLQSDRSAARLPVIVLSADTSEATRFALRAAGADVILPKPADPVDLLSEIGRILPP